MLVSKMNPCTRCTFIIFISTPVTVTSLFTVDVQLNASLFLEYLPLSLMFVYFAIVCLFLYFGYLLFSFPSIFAKDTSINIQYPTGLH